MEGLVKEVESLKMNVSMLTTLVQSQQMLLSNLTKAIDSSPAPEPPKAPPKAARVVSPKKVELTTRVHEWLANSENINKKGLTLPQFIDTCEEKIKGLPLQDTGERLDETLSSIVKTVYDSLDPKKKPFFGYSKTQLVYQDKYKNWIFDSDAVVKSIMFLEKQLRNNQMDQLSIEDMDHMSAHEQESYLEYSVWTTSDIDKHRILRNIMDFAFKIELD